MWTPGCRFLQMAIGNRSAGAGSLEAAKQRKIRARTVMSPLADWPAAGVGGVEIRGGLSSFASSTYLANFDFFYQVCQHKRLSYASGGGIAFHTR
jgi:hypothetical protein